MAITSTSQAFVWGILQSDEGLRDIRIGMGPEAPHEYVLKNLDQYFECKVEIPWIRVGKRQTVETLIGEEGLLFAKFLRGERKAWTPRLAVL